MSKAYKVFPRTIHFGEHKGEAVYTVRPVNYGTLTSDDAARQIAAESTASPGDVKNVLDRYAYYVAENLKKGYAIELLGFGKITLRFITGKAVTDEKKANASLVKGLVPAFRPSFTIVNGSRLYDLIPDKISLVKYGDAASATADSGDSGETGGDGGGSDAGGSPDDGADGGIEGI